MFPKGGVLNIEGVGFYSKRVIIWMDNPPFQTGNRGLDRINNLTTIYQQSASYAD